MQAAPLLCAFSIPTRLIEFSLGAVAGGAGAFAAYPFDYVKSQMQTEVGKAKYANSFECVMDTFQQGGPLLFYRGAVITSLGNAPEKALKLNAYDFAKGVIVASNGGTITLGCEILAGAISGVLQVVLTSPLETVKVALQTSDMTMEEVIEDIEGLPGLFKGAETCIARDVIFNAILFPVYSNLRVGIPDSLAGSVAGLIATFVATPTDVVKTRILSQDVCARTRRTTSNLNGATVNGATVPAFASSSKPRSTTTTAMSAMSNDYAEGDDYCESYNTDSDYLSDRNPFAVAYKIAENEGPMVLFSGVVTRCIGSVPRFGVTLALHDLLKTVAVQQHWM